MGVYFEKFDAQANKMANLMDANGLLHKFCADKYPITMTVQPNTTPSDQMEMFETSTDGVSSEDAKLVLQFFVGEIVVRVYGRLIISDALMGKIKNQAKKMRDLWLQADFASRMEQAGCSYSNTQDKAPDEEVHEEEDEEDVEDVEDVEAEAEDDDSQE